MAPDSTPAGGQTLSDAELIDALSFVMDGGGRVTMSCSRVTFIGDDEPSWGFRVDGGDLGGAYLPTLRESLSDWVTSLVRLSELDPTYFARFAALAPAASPDGGAA